jgi:hypothetical protein
VTLALPLFALGSVVWLLLVIILVVIVLRIVL